MTVRSLPLVAILALSGCAAFAGFGAGASAETLASFRPGANGAAHRPSLSASLSLAAYRDYVKSQTDLLAGMTRVLVREIKDGDLDAAQSAYAPAHRYLARIAPVVRLMRELDERLDAPVAEPVKAADPNVSGFHRIEYGLFATRSTKDLTVQADALLGDVRALRAQAKLVEIDPDLLVAESVKLVADIAAHSLDGDEERYSRTDLWAVEAKIDGVRQVIRLVRPALRPRTDMHFAAIDALMEKHKAGCGFKNYDELTRDDKAALKREITALAGALAAPQGASALD